MPNQNHSAESVWMGMCGVSRHLRCLLVLLHDDTVRVGAGEHEIDEVIMLLTAYCWDGTRKQSSP